MGKSGPVITLEVMKGAAFYHGLAKLVEDIPNKSKLLCLIPNRELIMLRYVMKIPNLTCIKTL